MQNFEAQQIDKDYPEIAFYDKLKEILDTTRFGQ